MRFEARRQRGGRCRVRDLNVGNENQFRYPRERNRAMQKSIEHPAFLSSYSFSGHVHARIQLFGQSFVTFVKNSRKTLARTDPRSSVGYTKYKSNSSPRTVGKMRTNRLERTVI